MKLLLDSSPTGDGKGPDMLQSKNEMVEGGCVWTASAFSSRGECEAGKASLQKAMSSGIKKIVSLSISLQASPLTKR